MDIFFFFIFFIKQVIYINNSVNIWVSKSEVFSCLDSLRNLQLASISDLILISCISFLATLIFHREERKWAIAQVTGKLCSCWQSKSRVRILEGVIAGTALLSPWRRTLLAGWLASQSNMACCKVSIVWLLVLHLLQWGDWFGKILATLSAVGRIWWSILNKKLDRLGSRMLCCPSTSGFQKVKN